MAKHSEHMPLNRQAEVMARHGVPIDRSVLADWLGRTGAEIAPVVDHMAERLLGASTWLYVDEMTAPVLDPGRGKTKTGYLWAVLRDDRSWKGSAPPGVVYVWSMDSRAGAVSETVEATGSLEAAQELATHSTPKMIKRYSRGDGLQSSRRIAEMRAEKRK